MWQNYVLSNSEKIDGHLLRICQIGRGYRSCRNFSNPIIYKVKKHVIVSPLHCSLQHVLRANLENNWIVSWMEHKLDYETKVDHFLSASVVLMLVIPHFICIYLVSRLIVLIESLCILQMFAESSQNFGDAEVFDISALIEESARSWWKSKKLNMWNISLINIALYICDLGLLSLHRRASVSKLIKSLLHYAFIMYSIAKVLFSSLSWNAVTSIWKLLYQQGWV